MAKIKLLLALFVFSHTVSGQTVVDILDNIYNQYSAEKPLNFESHYNLFKTHDSKELYQSYRGEFHKDSKNSTYVKIDKTEILNNKRVNLKISHDEKAMIVSSPDLNVVIDYDMSALLKIYKEDHFLDKGSYWEIVLVANEITLPHSKIILQVGKDYFLKKQIFYYSEAINFSKDYTKTDISRPRLEIVYSGYNRNLINETKFNTSTFLQMESDRPITPVSKLKHYEVLDRR